MSTQIELTDLLAGFAAARDEATAPDGAARLPVVAAQVRRRRLVRTVTVSGLAAAAVLGIAAGVYGLTRPDPTPPVESPTPTVTPSPTPTPTEEPTEEPTQEPPQPLGEVTVHPLLPAAQPLMEGVLEETTPAWSMVTYYDQDLALGPEVDHPTVLYLVAPDGSVMEVPTPVSLMAPCTFCDGSSVPAVREWLPGTSLAIVTPLHDDNESVLHWQMVDLLTGEVLVAVDGEPGSFLSMRFVHDDTADVLVVREDVVIGESARIASIERRHADGTLAARFDGGYETASPYAWDVSPDGSLVSLHGLGEALVLRASDLGESARVRPAALDCPAGEFVSAPLAPVRWHDDATLWFRCSVQTADARLLQTAWLVPLQGQAQVVAREVAGYVAGSFAGHALLHLADENTWYVVRPDGSRYDAPILSSHVITPPDTEGMLTYTDDVYDDNRELTQALHRVDLLAGTSTTLLAPVDLGSTMFLADDR